VFKGKRMPGRMGGEKTTVMNLDVVQVDADRNIVMVRGAVPGPKGAVLVIREAVKAVG
jgi:large subunit ribosomal protein L3